MRQCGGRAWPRARRRVTLAASAVLGVGLIFASSAPDAAATTLPTTITADTTLTAAASPYTGSSTTVNSGVTLTVEAGAVVKLSGSLTVNGTLAVTGTAANPAVFSSTTDSGAGQWSGITLNTSSSAIDHAEIRYASTAVTGASGVSPSITNSTIRNNSVKGISLNNPGSTAAVTGNTLSNNAKGIYTAAGSAEIANNTISDCSAGSYGIFFEAGVNSSGQVRIHDNTVLRCGAGASQAPYPSSYAAITVYGRASYENSTVTGSTLGGNTVRDGGRPIDYYVDPGSSTVPADIDENTLSGNNSNSIWVAGKVATSTTWENHGFVMVPRGGYNLKVASGATLTLGAGLVLKPYQSNAQIQVDGALAAQESTPQCLRPRRKEHFQRRWRLRRLLGG